MARVGGLNDSQTGGFFIVHADSAHLDNKYASFGGVIAGFDQVERSEFAAGTGEEAIERAFKHAAEKRGL